MTQRGISSILIILIIVGVLVVGGGLYWWLTGGKFTRAGMCYKNLSNLGRSGIPSMPNPAAVFCTCMGGKYGTEKTPTGGEKGVCQIEGRTYDGWEYFCEKNKDDNVYANCRSYQTKSQDETADWKTYRNERYIVSFKYPSDWKFYQNSEQSFSVEKTVAIPGAPKSEFGGSFNLRIFPNPKEVSLIDWFDKNRKSLWSNPADTSFELKELPAVKVYESNKDRGGQAYSSLTIYAKNNDAIYEFECYGIDEYLKETYNKILDSISFE